MRLVYEIVFIFLFFFIILIVNCLSASFFFRFHFDKADIMISLWISVYLSLVVSFHFLSYYDSIHFDHLV